LKQESNVKRRYYERFQVEDVINFFSGQLLQAKSPDGAQFFLQCIKISHRPLPPNYQDSLRKLQHPHLAPIIDVMEEEDQIILVHPPFSGDPLPLIVNKERPMSPDVAVRVVNKCFKTLQDLNRLPVPLSATLDPKNILLNGHKPLILFYYMKKEAKQGHVDEKWRDLLYFLLTGQSPSGGIKACEKMLETKNVPSKITKLALDSLDRKYTYDQIAQMVDQYVKSKLSGENHLSRSSKKKSYKGTAIAVSVAAAALVLISLTVVQWKPTDGNASNSSPFANMFSSESVDQASEQEKQEPAQSIPFNKTKNMYTLPYTFQGETSLRGEFQLKQLNGFMGFLENTDESAMYGLYIDKDGIIHQFHKLSDQNTTIGDSGSEYRIQPGKKYVFEMFYFPGEPLRISIHEEGKTEKWMSVGVTPVNGELRVRFRGNDGATLFYPKLEQITDRRVADRSWMNEQPWQIDFGQAILNVDQDRLNHLKVYPKTQIRLNATAASKFQFSPPKSSQPFHMDLTAVDNSRFRLVWDQEEKKLVMYKIDESSKKVAEQTVNWKLKEDDLVQASIVADYNKLQIELSHGSDEIELVYENSEPISIRDVTIRNTKEFELIEINEKKDGPTTEQRGEQQ